MTQIVNSAGGSLAPYLGRTLDEKYRLERLLGRGGMGAVYLSTHLGTGRSVAVKLITPEFTRDPECIERFKREARAAGRLRHPNIVDVTDFGVTRLGSESIAYLVMEYLDGCTLAQVLNEQKKLSLHWTIAILEQACAAIHKAHEQGIIHRDLKPANIWLEPNTLGGFRVKVLDFGIAKLAEEPDPPSPANSTSSPPEPLPLDSEKTLLDVPSVVPGKEAAPAGQPTRPVLSVPEDGVDYPNVGVPPSFPTEALTRVGAILGTPLFMSPEQCRGEPLDARSDLYSLGVIAYQMLSGTTPFSGETAAILRAHQQDKPIPLRKRRVNAPRSVSRLIMSALDKDPNGRPPNALAFAHALRASSETFGVLCRRAFALYAEYFPRVVGLSLLAHIPAILLGLLLVLLPPQHSLARKLAPLPFEVTIGFVKSFATFIAASIISGVVSIVVSQLAVMPLKPVSLRAAFGVVRERWRPFLKTGIRATLWIYLGFVVLVIPGVLMMTRYVLWAPVSLLERLEGRAALSRSRVLAARSPRTAFLTVLFQLGVTAAVPWAIGRLINAGASDSPRMADRFSAELSSLGSVLVMPLVSIVVALVYLKLRQLGGEAPVATETLPEVPAMADDPTRLFREEP